MKILAISDTHGDLPMIKEEFDLFLICGDICPVDNHSKAYQSNWIESIFTKWVKELPFKDNKSMVVLIPGNHDFIFEVWPKDFYKHIEKEANNRLKVLVDEEFVYQGIRIYGTPWCKTFGNWAYMRDYDKLKMIYDNIPADLDILMTHDAPSINDFGHILMGRWSGEDASNIELGKAIEEKRPRIAIHGHIHSSRHDFRDYNGIWMTCVSFKDEDYTPYYPILSFEYDPETKKVKYDD